MCPSGETQRGRKVLCKRRESFRNSAKHQRINRYSLDLSLTTVSLCSGFQDFWSISLFDGQNGVGFLRVVFSLPPLSSYVKVGVPLFLCKGNLSLIQPP